MIQASKLHHEGISATTDVWSGVGWGGGGGGGEEYVFLSINMIGTKMCGVSVYGLSVLCMVHTHTHTHTHTHLEP